MAKIGCRMRPHRMPHRPPRHGGIARHQDLSRGRRSTSRLGPAAGLSMGDFAFQSGDGEITFCGAIEMPGGCISRSCHQERASPNTASRTPCSAVAVSVTPAELQGLADLRRHFFGRRSPGNEHYRPLRHHALPQGCLNANRIFLPILLFRPLRPIRIRAPLRGRCAGHISGVVRRAERAGRDPVAGRRKSLDFVRQYSPSSSEKIEDPRSTHQGRGLWMDYKSRHAITVSDLARHVALRNGCGQRR